MLQCSRLSCVLQHGHPTRAPASVPAAPPPTQFPVNVPQEAANDGPSDRPYHHVEDLDETPGSWPQPGPTIAVLTIWEVNQWMGNLPPTPQIKVPEHLRRMNLSLVVKSIRLGAESDSWLCHLPTVKPPLSLQWETSHLLYSVTAETERA